MPRAALMHRIFIMLGASPPDVIDTLCRPLRHWGTATPRFTFSPGHCREDRAKNERRRAACVAQTTARNSAAEKAPATAQRNILQSRQRATPPPAIAFLLKSLINPRRNARSEITNMTATEAAIASAEVVHVRTKALHPSLPVVRKPARQTFLRPHAFVSAKSSAHNL